MCTLSWLIGQDSYDVFFNRDEQRSRSRAEPPQIFSFPSFPPVDKGQVSAPDIRSIMPIDPSGGGTWLAVNEFGWTFALLNYYQGRLPKGALRSRGQIVKDLTRVKCINEIDVYFNDLSLNKFAPFSLMVFSPVTQNREKTSEKSDSKTHADDQSIKMIRWTGKELEFARQASPLFSSAVKFDEVSSSRYLYVQSELNKTNEAGSKQSQQNQYRQKVSLCIDIHKSHEPSKSAFSICMHRDDAKTVSFSHVSVNSDVARYTYTDGAPCETSASQPLELRLQN